MELDDHLNQGHRELALETFGVAMSLYAQAEDTVRKLVAQMSMFIREEDHFGNQVDNVAPIPLLDEGAARFRTSLDPKTQYIRRRTDTRIVTQDTREEFDIPAGRVPTTFPYTAILLRRLAERYDDRQILSINTPADLAVLEQHNLATFTDVPDLPGPSATYPDLQERMRWIMTTW